MSSLYWFGMTVLGLILFLVILFYELANIGIIVIEEGGPIRINFSPFANPVQGAQL
jgi:hypothetical protein